MYTVFVPSKSKKYFSTFFFSFTLALYFNGSYIVSNVEDSYVPASMTRSHKA